MYVFSVVWDEILLKGLPACHRQVHQLVPEINSQPGDERWSEFKMAAIPGNVEFMSLCLATPRDRADNAESP